MVIWIKWATFWFVLISIGQSDGRSQGLHVIKAPSSEELLAQRTNSTPLISVVVTTDDVAAGGDSDQVERRVGDDSENNGRSIVTSLSRQASNIGKGFMEFLRGGNPPPPALRRPVMPYPGPPMMRPRPLPHGFHPGRPTPHLTLSSEPIADKDRVGPSHSYAADKLEGGFMPSKKLFSPPHPDSPHAASSSSVAINTSTLVLPAPKAPCDFYTDSLCIEANPYPSEQMRHRLRTIDLGQPSVRRMLADVGQQNANILADGLTVQEEILYSYEHYYGSEDNNTHSYRDYASDGGFVCPSDIKYVRLQKGRSAYGQWKFIVNFDELAQTVRLEKCLKPYSRCSYVFSYLNSECIQIYNFHRLLAWDAEHGFHIDVFKIPSACSCHIRSASNANAVLTDSGRTASESTSSSKMSFGKAKDNGRKKMSADHQSEMATEKSYASAVVESVRTSQPDAGLMSFTSGVDASAVSSDHVVPLGKHAQSKPSRFMLGLEPSAVQQLHLNLNAHRTPDFRLVTSHNANNPNKWSLNMRQGHPSSSTDRVAKLDGSQGPAAAAVSSAAGGSSPFRRLSRPTQGGRKPGTGLSQRRSDVRRVNLNRNPVSDFMHAL